MQACEGPHQLPTPTQGALFGLMRHAARTDNLEEKDAAALTDPRAVWAEVRAGQYMYGAAVSHTLGGRATSPAVLLELGD
jgi:hypothetical protein